LEAGTRRIDDLFSAEAEELSLFSPVSRQPRRQAHQSLGGELRRFSAIDDGRGDVGRQPGKTQEGIEVGCRHVLFASDIMHGQLGVLDQARLDVVSDRNDMGKVIFDNVLYEDVQRALEENLDLLDPEKDKSAHNITLALAYIVRHLVKLQRDVDLLHNKLQPMLAEDRYPTYDDHRKD
jgi:hypothetical protein